MTTLYFTELIGRTQDKNAQFIIRVTFKPQVVLFPISVQKISGQMECDQWTWLVARPYREAHRNLYRKNIVIRPYVNLWSLFHSLHHVANGQTLSFG